MTFSRFLWSLFSCIAVLSLARAYSIPSPPNAEYEAWHRRSYFYAGGQYAKMTSPSSNVTSTYMTGQIYVERLEPLHILHKYPLIFIHGLAQTGTNWLNTPDGREGWASYFLERGYVVYLTDQAQRGRSPWFPGDGQLAALSVEQVEKQFTASQNFPSYPQAALHSQWPGTGLAGDPVFDALYAAQVPSQSNITLQALYNNASYTALLDEIGPAIVFAHSQAGPFAWKLADERPHLVKALVALEPSGPPFKNFVGPPFAQSWMQPSTVLDRPYGLTLLPLAFDPSVNDNSSLLATQNISAPNANLSSCVLQAEPARRLVSLAQVPVLFVTGEASYHAVYDHCTVVFLRQAGVEVEYLDLGKAGIHGNGHFVFLELNNLEVAGRVGSWLDRYDDA